MKTETPDYPHMSPLKHMISDLHRKAADPNTNGCTLKLQHPNRVEVKKLEHETRTIHASYPSLKRLGFGEGNVSAFWLLPQKNAKLRAKCSCWIGVPVPQTKSQSSLDHTFFFREACQLWFEGNDRDVCGPVTLAPDSRSLRSDCCECIFGGYSNFGANQGI